MKTPLLLILLFSTSALRPVGAVEIEGLPAAAPAREAKFAEAREKTLGNGLRVIAVEREALPLISASLVIRTGAEADPPTAAGLAAFTAELLTQGTVSRTAMQIAAEVEALGASLRATAAWDATSVALSTLSSQAEPSFLLLADVARHPLFAAAEIERLRLQKLDELRLAMQEPGTVARLAASRLLLGSGLYAHPAAGTPASIKRLRRAEIAQFHAVHYEPRRALLIIAGSLTAEAAFALAEKAFGDWTVPAEAGPAPTEDRFTPVDHGRAVVIDTPGAGQAAVVLGVPGIARGADDYYAGELANAVLGGGYSARLNQEIRVKRGLSYGASSTLATLRLGGICTAHCQTKNASVPEVVKLMQAEMARLGSEPVPAAFLATRQTVFAGDFARELETNDGYVTRLADFVLNDLPVNSTAAYLARIRSVSAEDVGAFARVHLRPEEMSLAVVGRAQDFSKPLRLLYPHLEVIPQAALDLDSATLRQPKKKGK